MIGAFGATGPFQTHSQTPNRSRSVLIGGDGRRQHQVTQTLKDHLRLVQRMVGSAPPISTSGDLLEWTREDSPLGRWVSEAAQRLAGAMRGDVGGRFSLGGLSFVSPPALPRTARTSRPQVDRNLAALPDVERLRCIAGGFGACCTNERLSDLQEMLGRVTAFATQYGRLYEDRNTGATIDYGAELTALLSASDFELRCVPRISLDGGGVTFATANGEGLLVADAFFDDNILAAAAPLFSLGTFRRLRVGIVTHELVHVVDGRFGRLREAVTPESYAEMTGLSLNEILADDALLGALGDLETEFRATFIQSQFAGFSRCVSRELGNIYVRSWTESVHPYGTGSVLYAVGRLLRCPGFLVRLGATLGAVILAAYFAAVLTSVLFFGGAPVLLAAWIAVLGAEFVGTLIILLIGSLR